MHIHLKETLYHCIENVNVSKEGLPIGKIDQCLKED